MKWAVPLVIALLISFMPAQGLNAAGDFRITSSIFEDNGNIPGKYTCDGANVNPPLRIENVSPETKSLVFILDDRDAPRGTYVHWILWNIRPDTKEIKENSVPEGAVQGITDFKKRKYGGPCPPSRAHKYVFKIYALDIPLDLNPDSSKKDVEKAMKGHVIAEAQMTGIYKRKK
jgi:Raf kinase inhibitor-like YbhB/YbcL family protein